MPLVVPSPVTSNKEIFLMVPSLGVSKDYWIDTICTKSSLYKEININLKILRQEDQLQILGAHP